MVLRAIGSTFVLKDMRFRKNKSCLYHVNNNTVFHNDNLSSVIYLLLI